MAITKKQPAAKKKTAAKEKKPVKVAVKKTAVKKPVAKKAIVKKAAVKKPVAKKAVAKKPAAKKSVAVKKPVAKKAAVKKTASKPESTAPLGIPELLRDAALKVLDERQAEEITLIPLIGRSSIADYMILASGRASRQVTAIAEYLREAFFKLGVRQVRIEGMGEANWVLVDAGDVIIHLFRPEVRTYYDLDAIWNDKTAPK